MGCTCSQSSKNENKKCQNGELDPDKEPPIQRGDFTLEQMECIGSVWKNLRQRSVDNGLYLFQNFLTLYPEEKEKFAFNFDSMGNVLPNFHASHAQKIHSMKIMDAIDAVISEILRDHPIKQRLMDVGYAHYELHATSKDIRKLTTAFYKGVKDLIGIDDDNDRHLVAWKDFLNKIEEGFKEGLLTAEREDPEASEPRRSEHGERGGHGGQGGQGEQGGYGGYGGYSTAGAELGE